jgi:hypothetical protein
MSIEFVIERAVENALERLAGLQIASPAFAVALFSEDTEELHGGSITVGLQSYREAVLPRLQGPARLALWNPFEFTVAAPDEPQLAFDPAFVDAQTALLEELYGRDIADPQSYVLNRVAARLDPARLTFPVTEDFVAYTWTMDFYQLVENLRFSASPKSLTLLEAQELVFDLPDF